MGDRKESSLLFSLKELQDNEARRETERREVLRRREEAARAEQAERQRQARLAAEHERAEQERARAEADRARRDDEARRVAIGQALVERERIETRARMEAEIERERRRYEIELARVAGKRSARAAVLFGVGSTALTASVLVGIYFGFLAPMHADALASARRTANTERDRADQGERMLASLKDERKLLVKRVAEISHELSEARREQSDPPEPVRLTPADQKAGGTPRRTSRSRRPPHGIDWGKCDPNADPNDPMGSLPCQ